MKTLIFTLILSISPAIGFAESIAEGGMSLCFGDGEGECFGSMNLGLPASEKEEQLPRGKALENCLYTQANEILDVPMRTGVGVSRDTQVFAAEEGAMDLCKHEAYRDQLTDKELRNIRLGIQKRLLNEWLVNRARGA